VDRFWHQISYELGMMVRLAAVINCDDVKKNQLKVSDAVGGLTITFSRSLEAGNLAVNRQDWRGGVLTLRHVAVV